MMKRSEQGAGLFSGEKNRAIDGRSKIFEWRSWTGCEFAKVERMSASVL